MYLIQFCIDIDGDTVTQTHHFKALLYILILKLNKLKPYVYL